MVARLLVEMRLFRMIFPPLILLSGDSFSQETKWFSVFHVLISHPTSLTIVIAVMTSMPAIWVRSCETNLSANQIVDCPSFSCAVPCRSLPVEWLAGSDPLVARGSAPDADRTPLFASGKTRIPPVPAAAETADPLASCPPEPARSPPRWPQSGNPDMPLIPGDRVLHSESLSGWPALSPH